MQALIAYEDGTGANSTIRWEFYVDPPGTGKPSANETQVPQGAWTSHSFNLLDITPSPVTIREIRVGGSGWNFEGRVDNVELLCGAAGGSQAPGDCNSDGFLDLSDAICTFGYLFPGNPAELPCGDGNQTDPANVQLLDYNGDDAVDLSDGVGMLHFLFLGGPPHIQGEDCISVEGCEGTCVR